MVLQIALLDDEQEQLDRTTAMLTDYLQAHAFGSVKIRQFQSSFALLDEVERSGSFDLYFLDIALDERENGIEVARHLRKMDPLGLIIYLTNSPNFAVESYAIRAFHYLLKPVNKDHLAAVLDMAMNELARHREKGVLLKIGSTMRRVFFHQLLYAELTGRTICYHLTSEEKLIGPSLRRSFREAVSPFLTDSAFTLCGASYLVNLAYVVKVDKLTLTMQNGDKLPIPARENGQIKIALANYWLGGNKK